MNLPRRADLQALRIPWVTNLAGSASNTVGWSLPILTTTLSILWHKRTSWDRNLGSGDWWLDRGNNSGWRDRRAGGWWWNNNIARVEGRANWAELDVRESDGGVREIALDVLWFSDFGVTWATDGAWLCGSDWVGGIQPLHVGGMVVPDGHGENHWGIESLRETGHAAGLGEVVQVAESNLLLLAEVIGDLVGRGNTSNVGNRVGKDNAILDVEAFDALEHAAGGVVGSDELRDNGDLLVGVDLLARAEEGGVAHAVGVEVASVLVTDAFISVGSVTAVVALAAGESVATAGVWGVGRGVLVRLPDVHLGTAGSVAADTSICILGRGGPVEDIGLGVC